MASAEWAWPIIVRLLYNQLYNIDVFDLILIIKSLI